ncbi:hypothetical protein [Sporosarcina sp. P33]|nr:hypothetical protein [Sporosarcina sp. P33]
MKNKVEKENPRVFAVVADSLEDQQLVYTNILSVYSFFPLGKSGFY